MSKSTAKTKQGGDVPSDGARGPEADDMDAFLIALRKTFGTFRRSDPPADARSASKKDEA